MIFDVVFSLSLNQQVKHLFSDAFIHDSDEAMVCSYKMLSKEKIFVEQKLKETTKKQKSLSALCSLQGPNRPHVFSMFHQTANTCIESPLPQKRNPVLINRTSYLNHILQR